MDCYRLKYQMCFYKRNNCGNNSTAICCNLILQLKLMPDILSEKEVTSFTRNDVPIVLVVDDMKKPSSCLVFCIIKRELNLCIFRIP